MNGWLCAIATYQHPAMLVLYPLEELEDAVLHVGHQDGLCWRRIALPSANLEKC